MLDALALKYRPDSLETVIGQDEVISSLEQVIKRKTSKTFLFVGPSGTGKTTLARIVGTMVGCQDHDFQEIDAATFTGVEDMREVTKGLMYRPIGAGRFKMVIIDECHSLSKNAWQSLLKILEEPPSWVYWALCTTEAMKVPPTIVTRCARFELKPVSNRVIAEHIAAIAELENFECSGGVIDVCALNAHGSPRQALQNLAMCANITDRAEAARLLRSAEESSEAVELARLLIKGAKWSQALALINDLKEINPESIRHVVRSYVTKVVLTAERENVAAQGMAILDAFSQPFNSADGITPVLLAVGKLLLD